jgi:hypothetical protein
MKSETTKPQRAKRTKKVEPIEKVSNTKITVVDIKGNHKAKVCNGTLKIGDKFYKAITNEADDEVLKAYENSIMTIKDNSVYEPFHMKGNFVGKLYEVTNTGNTYYMGY